MAASRERWQLQDPGFGSCARGSSLGPLTPENSQKPRRRRAGNSEMRRRRRAALRFLVSFGGLGLTATRASSSRSAGTASVWSGQYGVSGLTHARADPLAARYLISRAQALCILWRALPAGSPL